MVVNDKVLVREMKEAFKGFGYTVMVTDGDRWVIQRNDAWAVEIEGQDNVPNEVKALIVLHMGHLPKAQQCYRIYKCDKGIGIQKEVYAVAVQNWRAFERAREETDGCPEEVRRTALVYGRRRVWQQISDKQVLLIDPRFEGLMDIGAESVVRAVGAQIYLEGEISCVYISQARGGASEALLDHLAKVKWT